MNVVRMYASLTVHSLALVWVKEPNFQEKLQATSSCWRGTEVVGCLCWHFPSLVVMGLSPVLLTWRGELGVWKKGKEHSRAYRISVSPFNTSYQHQISNFRSE
jgi:hypothetical protein